MVAAIVGLSIIAFLAIIIGSALGQSKNFATGLWPTVAAIPYYGLPLGLVLIIVLLVLSMRRRSREARESEKK
jgi:TRAP-type C4-dicarboxylate transport system permease small subunit